MTVLKHQNRVNSDITLHLKKLLLHMSRPSYANLQAKIIYYAVSQIIIKSNSILFSRYTSHCAFLWLVIKLNKTADTTNH
jgi:hypothetical protein